MRFNFLLSVALTVLATSAPVAAQSAPADLVGVYKAALANDPQLRAASYQRDAALQSKPAARAAILPQLSGNASISKQRDEITQTVTPIDANGNPVGPAQDATFSTTSEPFNYGLTLQQALFNREAFVRLRQADDQIAAAQAQYQAAEQALALRVAEAYFNVLAAQDNLRFSESEFEAVGRQLEQAQKRFEVGLSAITDVQEAQARADLTNSTRLQAQQQLNTSKLALSEIVGKAPEALTPLMESIPLLGPDPSNIDAWVKTALDDNLSLIAAQIQVDIASKDLKIATAGHYPTLNLQGSQTYGESSGFNNGEFEQSRVTLNLNVPIFSGYATRSAERRTISVREQRLAELEQTRRQVERQTRDAYFGVLIGAARVKALKQAVVSNQTAFEASDIGLEVGTRTAVDVLNSQQLLYSAQRDYARARYDYLLSVLRLKSAAGRLYPADLSEINRLLES